MTAAAPLPVSPVTPARHPREGGDGAEGARAPFDVVALVSSAGGLGAISTVLRDLPAGFPAAVLVMQHLGTQGSALAGILARRTALPVAWVVDGAPLEPGRVYVCPPRQRAEVLPDATCALTPAARGARDRPFDDLLTSLADSFGPRAMAVVLTGMGRDGAAGALALKGAGGTVLVQSEDTAEHPSMPRAAAESGAADLVLPLHEIGPAVAAVMAGGRLPQPRAEVEAAEALFAGPGEVRALLRAIDWAYTPLGPVAGWPAALRTTLRLVLESPMPVIVLWGPDYVQLYNDHYRLLMGDKHPAGLARPNAECWPEVWDLNQPLFARVTAGEPVALRNAHYPITRHGSLEDAWFDLSYAPVRDEHGLVAGVLATITETTSQVLAERRLRTLHRLGTEAPGATTTRIAFERALAALADAEDVPYALGYLLSAGASRVQLVGAIGVEAGSAMAPHTIDLQGGHPAWPLARVVADASPLVLDDLEGRFRGFRVGPSGEAPGAAMLLPLRPTGDERLAGVLVAGVSGRRPLDDAYREFLELVATQVGASLGEARARQRERQRAEQMAELDQAKTEFFSNVSHEFRTPLTLLLAPLEELRRGRDALPGPVAEEVEVAARNARRLLGLVDTLLDFSRLEAGRQRAHPEPVDLAALTTDVASAFRSAAERAGIALRVSCPPLAEAVWVDRQMWEQIVSNLLANALKFTFAGEVAVELRALQQHAELAVRDTGVGIPAAELPHVFERFHRVRGARARTQEGSGIGLALVHELVRQHHGRVRVASEEGAGTTFTVWVPLGARRRAEPGAARAAAAAATSAAGTARHTAEVAAALADQAMRWDVPDGKPEEVPDVLDPAPGPAPGAALAAGARVLVVDDNADMRGYLRRLLAPPWTVETARDGTEALARAREAPPDLILADVMMPGLDGFALLGEVRRDERLQATPVVLLTARAGEEAAIEGLLAGADDYITKPFSARELVARVGAQLELARVRREAGAAVATRERRMAEILESLNESFYALDASFCVTAVNRHAEAAWGRRREEIIGRHLWTEFPAAVGTASYDTHLEAMRTRRPARFETCSPVLRRWIEVSIHPNADGGLSVFFHDIEARKRDEAVLRASEARQAFLLALDDALRPLADPMEVQGAAARLLGAHLGADYTHYGETVGDEVVVHRSYAPGRPSAAGRYRAADFGAPIVALREGRTAVSADVEVDPAVPPAVRAVFAAAGFRAHVSVPLVKEGAWVATFAVISTGPRAWTPDEVALVEEVAERTWAAVERARAEAALRESEARFRALAAASAYSVYRMNPDWSEMRELDGRGFISDTPTPRRTWLEHYIPPEEQPRVLAAIRRAVRERRVFELEHQVRRADGSLGWTLSRAVPLFGADGEVVEWFGAASDVTARKAAEAALAGGAAPEVTRD